MLITKMCEKEVFQPPSTQNIQMMRSELRKEDLNIHVMLGSGMAIGEDKGKQPEEDTWVHKAPVKEVEFDLDVQRRHSWKLRRASWMPPL